MPKAKTLLFAAPNKTEIRESDLPALKEDEVLVETIVSAISAGTEMLVYRGQFSQAVDLHDSISSDLSYPLAYGYACVGVVRETGIQIDKSLLGKLVFAFQPHTSHFITHPSSFILLPEGISPETACFLPSMETAVNLVQDAAPILGERVLVLGQGVVGLLAAALLKEFPLEILVSADHFELRRKASPADVSLDSSSVGFHSQARSLLKTGADLTLELSGNPAALDTAIELTAFSGRIVIGSWYGEKKAQIDLGGAFHRSRIKLISSQVSTISPELSGRWDKSRRFDVVWNALNRIQPEKWITHRIPIDEAGKAYALLDKNPQETIQFIFDYKS
ncbi:MAG: zinc-binding alcohol dehydrogenase [Chloroflexi bacterium]|nr:zinc-binding alcohol dehydrogenase [Chloroflexota bacterium]